MDPVTALGLATSVITVIETSVKVTLLLKQVHERGSLRANDALKYWAQDVSKDDEQLQSELKKQNMVQGPLDKRIRQLAEDSLKVSEELKRLLKNIAYHQQVAGGRASALKQVVRTYLKKGQIDRLIEQLKKCEATLDSGIIRALYVRCGEAQVLNLASFSTLSQGQQNIVKQMVDNSGRLQQSIVNAVNQQTVRSQDTTISETRAVVTKSEGNITTRMQQLHIDEVQQRKALAVLQSLRFDTMNHRQDFIQQRVGDYGETFKWIFEPDQGHQFYEWLMSNNRLFWISGKPGSGKSSLVDYIHEQLQPRRKYWPLLSQWAGSTTMKVLSFFFYRPAADQLQKSFFGLWRALCFQLLNGEAALLASLMCDDNAPRRFQQHLVGGSLKQSSWLTKDLEELFFYLVQKLPCKIFILLDGLDEVDDCDHFNLVSTVMRLSSIEKLKICCASRPQEPFKSALISPFSLQVQQLTYEDIYQVVSEKLQDTRASELAHDIVARAEGVFLWAMLVTDDICGACTKGETLEELQARISDVSLRFSQSLRPRHVPSQLELLLLCCQLLHAWL